MSEHDDQEIGRRLRRAADELQLRHGRESARVPVRRWMPFDLRWAVIGVPVVALLVAIGLVAAQLAGSERPGSLFDPGATESPTTSPEPVVGPVPPDVPPKLGRECHPMPETRAPEGIKVTVETSKQEVARDGQLTFTVRMQNNGLQPVSNRRGGQEYDILVRGPEGKIWLWSHNLTFGFPAIFDTYQPGEMREGVEEWDVRANCVGGLHGGLAAGTYQAIGIWVTQNGQAGREGWWSDPVTFEIR